MEKFNRVLRGYDPEEVNAFLDQVIAKVESMVNDIKAKNLEIDRLKQVEQEYKQLQDKNVQSERMEETLKRAILMAEKTSEQIRLSAHQEQLYLKLRKSIMMLN